MTWQVTQLKGLRMWQFYQAVGKEKNLHCTFNVQPALFQKCSSHHQRVKRCYRQSLLVTASCLKALFAFSTTTVSFIQPNIFFSLVLFKLYFTSLCKTFTQILFSAHQLSKEYVCQALLRIFCTASPKVKQKHSSRENFAAFSNVACILQCISSPHLFNCTPLQPAFFLKKKQKKPSFEVAFNAPSQAHFVLFVVVLLVFCFPDIILELVVSYSCISVSHLQSQSLY